MALPGWLFPTQNPNDSILNYFYLRSPTAIDSFAAHWQAVPWAAWITPLAMWGIFIAFLYGAILCMALIVRQQWTENERLTFPLATVYQSLIEEPTPGRAINPLLASRSFWIAFAAVFALHGINALHEYVPRIPPIPLSFDLRSLTTEGSWQFADPELQMQAIYFSVIGLTFLVQTRIAFSIWVFFILLQVAKIAMGGYHVELTTEMKSDQLFGGMTTFAIALLWVGRHHWWNVIRHLWTRDGDRLLRFAAWGLLVSFLGMVVWLRAAGMTAGGALVLVLMLMMVYFVLAHRRRDRDSVC